MTRGRRNSRIELSRRALRDLVAIEQFSVEEWGRKTTDEYLADIAAALDRLQQNPDLLRIEPDIITGVSFYRVRNHVLVCDYQRDLIIVLTVIHTSMDLRSRLLELEPRLEMESAILRKKLHGPSIDDSA